MYCKPTPTAGGLLNPESILTPINKESTMKKKRERYRLLCQYSATFLRVAVVAQSLAHAS